MELILQIKLTKKRGIHKKEFIDPSEELDSFSGAISRSAILQTFIAIILKLMKHHLFLILPLVAMAATAARSQIAAIAFHPDYRASAATTDFNTDFAEAFKLEAFLGASASLASGDYIDYQKSFHDVVENGTEFSGAIQPVYMATGGLQARYTPFEDGILEKLGVSLGLQYVQKGFTSKFHATHTSPLVYTDVTDYKETFRHNYLAVPVQVRWGTKWFATLGLSFFRHLSSTKIQKLYREQSERNPEVGRGQVAYRFPARRRRSTGRAAGGSGARQLRR